jgi:hypothetical protein
MLHHKQSIEDYFFTRMVFSLIEPMLSAFVWASETSQPRYVPYKGTYVPYDGTYGVPDQGQSLDV